MARPTKYKKKYCKMLIEHMAQGLSFDSFAGEISVCRDTLYEWTQSHEEFSDAKKVGTAKRNLLGEKLYINAMLGKKIKGHDGVFRNARDSLLIFWTKNVLGWTDKPEDSRAVDDEDRARLVIEYSDKDGSIDAEYSVVDKSEDDS